MANGLLLDADPAVASWVFDTYKLRPSLVDKAIGIVTKEGRLCGGVLFQCWNGYNVEICYYGEKTISAGIIRFLARFLASVMNVSRATVHVSKKDRHLMHSLQRLGFKLEGAQRLFYGSEDIIRNTAIRFVMFRDQIDYLAKLPTKEQAKQV